MGLVRLNQIDKITPTKRASAKIGFYRLDECTLYSLTPIKGNVSKRNVTADLTECRIQLKA